MDDIMSLINTNIKINQEELPPVAQIENLNKKNQILKKEQEEETTKFGKVAHKCKEVERFIELAKIHMNYEANTR